MKFAVKPIHYPPHLRYVTTLPRDIKNSNLCRYSAHIEENANKLHFKRTSFNFTARVTVHAECVCFYQNLVLIAVYHVDC